MKTSYIEEDTGSSDGFHELMSVLVSNIEKVPPRSNATQRLSSLRPSQDLVHANPPGLSARQKTMLANCVDTALSVMGRIGRDVFFEILEKRYGVAKSDIADSPTRFMSVLKLLFDTSASAMERYMLEEIQHNFGVSAHSFEEAVNLVRMGSTPNRKLLRGTCPQETETQAEANALACDAPSHIRSEGNVGVVEAGKFVYHYSSADCSEEDERI